MHPNTVGIEKLNKGGRGKGGRKVRRRKVYENITGVLGRSINEFYFQLYSFHYSLDFMH